MEKIKFDFPDPATLRLTLSGKWLIFSGIPLLAEVSAQFSDRQDIKGVVFSISNDFEWDTSFVTFLIDLAQDCSKRNIEVIFDGLPQQAIKLFDISFRLHQKAPSLKHKLHENFVEVIGERTLEVKESAFSFFEFLGEILIAFLNLIRGKAYFRWDDFMVIVQKCGVDAIGLVSLISLLVGIILAFIGAIQLKIFGAQIYVADIVGIAMVRVMGAVMTGIIMAGRTGASFAAELGIMQTNEEIDALKTFAINPVEFLVLPRVLALVIMMPLLTIYANLMGILGGFIVSTTMLGINPVEYLNHTQAAVKLSNVWIGLTHGFVFGIIVAVCGCLRGINCERNSEGVGSATTSAVVTGITNIVIATAIITYICQALGV
ncbi:MAG: ABC transporter permease [Candidatus Omnitrophota bacterium]